MAKKLIPQTEPSDTAEVVSSNGGSLPDTATPALEYDLVGDILFHPPLTPEEQRRMYGLGMSMEERLEQARRQLSEGDDGF